MQKTLKEIVSKGFKVVDKDFERPWGGFLMIEEKQAQDFSNSVLMELASVNLK